MTEKVIKENEIEVGEEVFVTGLFSHHHGQSKNIPIVRVGNISAMPEEKIQTKEHLMDAYLIEARSIGGLSGSPVFVILVCQSAKWAVQTKPKWKYPLSHGTYLWAL